MPSRRHCKIWPHRWAFRLNAGHVSDVQSVFGVYAIGQPAYPNHVATLLPVGVRVEQVVRNIFGSPSVRLLRAPARYSGIGDGNLGHEIFHGDL